MRRNTLSKAVTIRGRDFWGRESALTISPKEGPGWSWELGRVSIPISERLLKTGKNRLILSHLGYELNVVEHLLPLRFLLGLDAVSIRCSSSWLPYDGSSEAYYQACEPHLRDIGEMVRYRTTETITGLAPKKERGGLVTLQPGPMGYLSVEVNIDYPGLGDWNTEWKMAPGERLDELARTPTQGWPKWRYPLAWAASSRLMPKRIRWPHFGNVAWPQRTSQHLALRQFASHRVLDFLGALALACPPDGILVGTAYSKCAGHAHDAELIAKVPGRLEEAGTPRLSLAK